MRGGGGKKWRNSSVCRRRKSVVAASAFFSFLFSLVDLLDRPRDVPAVLACLPRVLGHRQVGHRAREPCVVVDGDLVESW